MNKQVSLITQSCLFPVSEPPSPPENVQVNDLTKTACTLTWEPPKSDGGSPITGYYIEKSSGRSRFLKVNHDSISDVSKAFKDLIEGTEYEFRVLAENEAGLSKPSESSGIFVAKDPFDKPGKPEAPQVQDITKDEATITWEAPENDGGSPITNYIVEVKENGDKWRVKNDNVQEMVCTLTGLREGVAYEFRVSAVNKAGTGPASSPSSSSKYG